jgi:hypothetical protein
MDLWARMDPRARCQVRYQDGSRERSAGIYDTSKAAATVRKRIDRGLPPALELVFPQRSTGAVGAWLPVSRTLSALVSPARAKVS